MPIVPIIPVRQHNLRRGKGHYFRHVSKERSIFKLGKALQKRPKSRKSDEEKIRDFQRKLYLKAKQEKEFRFYVLYDKVRMMRFLREAYKRVKANRGSPGIDGITFKWIEDNGLEEYLHKIHEELAEKRYKSSPVLRVYIPKANGKTRPLGIPTIRDRIVQMSCKMVIEPIFEADFEDSSYGFRPNRSAQQAIGKIKEHLKAGRTEVFDADLSSYFDTIPHSKLMILMGKRISDKNVLHLIKMWLKAPISEDGKMKGGKKNKYGTPQGGVISPLLANIYLHLLDKIVNKMTGIFNETGVKIVRYADDFVLLGRKIPAMVLEKLICLLEKMELRLNEEKSKLIDAKDNSFDFLGFTIRYEKSRYERGRRYWNIIPSKKSNKRIREKIGTYLKTHGHLPPEILVADLNKIIRGWINYYTIPKVSYPRKSKGDLRYYLFQRVYRYYKRKSQRKSKLYGRKAFDVLVKKYGLIDPTKYACADSL